MSIETLQSVMNDQNAFRKEFKKDETIAELKGKFEPGRVPYVHQVTLPNGGQIRLKFVDTVKEILNSKGKPVQGKESFLSYAEVSVFPVGEKPYAYTTNVLQIVWATGKAAATVKHKAALNSLAADAAALGIDLSPANTWCITYSEVY